jgi:hypothetical protein
MGCKDREFVLMGIGHFGWMKKKNKRKIKEHI